MGILKGIRNFFQAGTGSSRRHLIIYVLNFRCNEPISAQIDLYNDLSPAEEERKDVSFYVRKILSTSGSQRCYDTNEVQVWLDGRRRVVDYEVAGGKWLEAEDYQVEMARFKERNAEDLAGSQKEED